MLQRLRQKIDPRDVAGLIGAGLISYGIAEIYRPAGLIAAGAFLLAAAALSARGA